MWKISAAIHPTSQDEKLLSTIWQEVLKIDNINVNDDFFKLGGNSLTAMRVISRVHTVFHCKLSIAAIFQNRSIKKLAMHITKCKKSSDII